MAPGDLPTLNIALVRARYSPYGGAERFAARAMQALGGQGVSVTVIARSWKGEGPQANVTWLPCNPFYIGSLWRERSFARAVHACLRRHHFDLVQSHERIPGLAVYRAGDGVHACWLERRAAGLNAWQRLGVRLNPYHRAMLATERRMFEHPALRAVICNSLLVRDEILQRFAIAPDKLHVIPNGIDLQQFEPGVRLRWRAPTRALLNLPAEVPVFLFVGSGFARKGLAAALDALARTTPTAHLIVVGDDKRAADYRARAARLGIGARVHFVGSVGDVLPYYGAADALVLPTVYDPFPNAALEAWACGLPVITSTACGAREALLEGINGWLSAADDVDAIGRAMDQLVARLADPAALAALQTAARAAALPYSLDRLGEALLCLYQSLLQSLLQSPPEARS
jgi:UDP-glucose:(heptosyl)LPS alpha-1,3-glucosyltransferase